MVTVAESVSFITPKYSYAVLLDKNFLYSVADVDRDNPYIVRICDASNAKPASCNNSAPIQSNFQYLNNLALQPMSQGRFAIPDKTGTVLKIFDKSLSERQKLPLGALYYDGTAIMNQSIDNTRTFQTINLINGRRMSFNVPLSDGRILDFGSLGQSNYFFLTDNGLLTTSVGNIVKKFKVDQTVHRGFSRLHWLGIIGDKSLNLYLIKNGVLSRLYSVAISDWNSVAFTAQFCGSQGSFLYVDKSNEIHYFNNSTKKNIKSSSTGNLYNVVCNDKEIGISVEKNDVIETTIYDIK